MICPFTFGNPACDADESCRSDCALLVHAVYVDDGMEVVSNTCAIAAIACDLKNARFVPQCVNVKTRNTKELDCTVDELAPRSIDEAVS